MTRRRILNIATIVSLAGGLVSASLLVRNWFASDSVMYRTSTPPPARAHNWTLTSGGGMIKCGWQYDDYRTPPGWHYDKFRATAWTDGMPSRRLSGLQYFSGRNLVYMGFTIDYKTLAIPLWLIVLAFTVLPVGRVVALLARLIARALPRPMVTMPAAAQQFRRD